MDPSQLDVKVEPRFVRVTVKKKVLQLRLADEEEVRCDAAKAERNTITGMLTVTMPRVAAVSRRKIETSDEKTVQTKAEPKKLVGTVDYRSIVKKPGVEEVVNESDVPPLEDIS